VPVLTASGSIGYDPPWTKGPREFRHPSGKKRKSTCITRKFRYISKRSQDNFSMIEEGS
jgi:hypothetical protein